jgi:antitoxin YefM
MDAITYTAARQDLAGTMDAVCDSHVPVVITRQKARPVVLMSLEDFNGMQETLYLLGNPANAEHLRASLADIEAGRVTLVALADLKKL